MVIILIKVPGKFLNVRIFCTFSLPFLERNSPLQPIMVFNNILRIWLIHQSINLRVKISNIKEKLVIFMLIIKLIHLICFLDLDSFFLGLRFFMENSSIWFEDSMNQFDPVKDATARNIAENYSNTGANPGGGQGPQPQGGGGPEYAAGANNKDDEDKQWFKDNLFKFFDGGFYQSLYDINIYHREGHWGTDEKSPIKQALVEHLEKNNKYYEGLYNKNRASKTYIHVFLFPPKVSK